MFKSLILSVAVWVLGLAVVLPAVGSAQAETGAQRPKNSLKKGMKALQFEVSQIWPFDRGNYYADLEPFLGSTISFKTHTDDATAYRIGLTVSFSFTDSDRSAQADTLQPRTDEIDSDNELIEITIQRVRYTSVTGKVVGFWGIGPMGQYRHNKTTANRLNRMSTPNDRLEETNVIKSWQAGMTGVFGVEWFLRHNISLLAEYHSKLYYSWGKLTSEHIRFVDGVRDRYDYVESTDKSFRLTYSDIRVGVSVYF